MIEAIEAALATEGLIWLVAGAALAGLVRGFSGFGTAMVYLPFAGAVLPPVWALITLIIMDVIGPVPNIPRAIRDGHPRDVMRLSVAALFLVPAGVWVLTLLSPDVFRYTVAIITLILLVMLVAGVRYRGRLSKPMIYATGGLGGFLAGCAGLPGPPVIMLYMASEHPPAVIRANTMLYLLLADIIMLVVFAANGLLELAPVLIGSIIAVPYLIANVAGAALFYPQFEKLYRVVAYLIIASSVLRGLPFFD